MKKIIFKNTYDKKVRIFNLFNYYLNLNYKKINKLKEKNYYSNSENIILILDIRKNKPKIFVINNNRCFLSITSGLIFKKLNLSKKKIKKSEKMLTLMIRTVFFKIKNLISYKKCLINIKGTKNNLFNIIININKIFKNKMSLMYEPRISYGRFKFKKIKSIKKRLRKKFTRLIKN